MANNNFCPFCGAAVSQNDSYETRFCPYCGKELPSAGQEDRPTAGTEGKGHEAPASPAPAPSSPAKKADPLFYPDQQTGPEQGGRAGKTASSGQAGGPRVKSRARWYLAIAAWAFAWSALVYAVKESFYSLALVIGLVLCGSMPLWYPRFHPDAKTKRGTVLRWTLIMIVILAVCYFLMEELA